MSTRGTIRKRCSCGPKKWSSCPHTWAWAFSVERGGSRKHVTKSGFRTKSAAKDDLAVALVAYGRQEYVAPSKLTLAEFLRSEWLPLQKASKKPSTYSGYEHFVEKRLIPELGDIRLTELTQGDIARVYAALRTGGRKDGKEGGLSERSLKQLHAVLHGALAHAVASGRLLRNPAALLPRDVKLKPRRVEMHTWSAEQLRAFLTSVDDDRLHACFTLAATTGMRRSELLGLRWEDVDFEHAQIAVRRGFVVAGYEVHEGAPKSGRARTIAVDVDTIAMLKRHRARQLEERLAWSEAWTDLGLLFTLEDGSAIHPQTLSQTFDRRVASTNLPRIRFHDLRHTHATLLLQAGVHPKVAQERLGHSSIAITLDIYSHVAPGMQEDAAAKLGALVFEHPAGS
jgi:integrase